MLKSVAEAERAERNQDADCARIDAAVRSAMQEIASLERESLGGDEMHKRWCAIRDRTIFLVRDVRRNIVQRANEARETERSIIEEFLNEKSDSPGQFLPKLQNVPTKDLVDYLRYLTQVGDRDGIDGIRAVFAARADRQRYNAAFRTILAQFALAQCGELAEHVAKISRSANQTDARIADLLSRRDHPTHANVSPTRQGTTKVVPLVSQAW